MACAFPTNSKSEPAEIEEIEETIEKAKKICAKLEHRSKYGGNENDTKIKAVLEEIIEKLDITICDSIILEETKTSVPSLQNEENEVEIVIQQAVKVNASENFKKPEIPVKMNYKNSIEIRQKSA